jgi:two-component system response regulator HydG
MVAAMVKLRIDRYVLADIVSDKWVLDGLLQIKFAISGTHETSRLLERLLDHIFTLVPAERGAVFFTGRKPETLDCVAFRNSAPNVNMDIALEAMSEFTGVISSGKNASSIICVPLTVFDSVLGVIYLDTTQKDAFTRSHLYLLIAISSITAVSLEHTRHIDHLESENQRLHEEIAQEHSANLEIIGDTPRMQDVRRFIGKVAPSDSSVLILGPSGTGKELVARAIHQNSRRASGPFVAVNCGAITATLVESELFGYEKGAFTGAANREKGKFESADGGTLFLDEVAELTMPMQAALLRVLQEREFHRVGGTKQVAVDVRVVAATNRNLETRIKEERFREDLYYRLNVVKLLMPSLADCRADIPLLASHFLKKLSYVRMASGFSTAALSVLTGYDWPGNIRELEHTVRRSLLFGTSDMILPEDLPEDLLTVRPPESADTRSYHAQIAALKRGLVERALTDAEGSYTDAARSLHVSASYFRRLVLHLKLNLP